MPYACRRVVRFAVVLACALALGSVTAGQRPDFSGAWEINDELSDNLRAKAHEARERQRAGGAGDGGMGGIGMGRRPVQRPGDLDGSDGQEERDRARARLTRIENGVEAMTIAQSARRIDIVYANDEERTLHPDGKKHGRERPYGPVTTKTAWKGSKLVVELTTEQGRKITETFELAADTPRLYVTVKLKGRGGKIVYRRVYDKKGAES